MKLKLLETVQGRDIFGVVPATGVTVNILGEGNVYDVGAALGQWLLDNNKAVPYDVSVHYGAQTKPTPREDNKIFDMMTTEKAKPPVEEDKPKKRGRK